MSITLRLFCTMERIMLTKRQLIKSPKDEYMSSDQLTFFKNLLQEQREVVTASIRSCRGTLVDNELESDPLDSASQEEIKHITLLRVQRDTHILHEIEQALDRIYHGEYGYCEETGDPIGIKRLLANPLTTLSIDACQNAEFRQRIEGNIEDEHQDPDDSDMDQAQSA